MRLKIKDYTKPRYKLYMDIMDLVFGLNRRLQGFKNYYAIFPIGKKWLNRIDWYVFERLALFYNKKRKKQGYFKDVRKDIDPLLVKLAS